MNVAIITAFAVFGSVLFAMHFNGYWRFLYFSDTLFYFGFLLLGMLITGNLANILNRRYFVAGSKKILYKVPLIVVAFSTIVSIFILVLLIFSSRPGEYSGMESLIWAINFAPIYIIASVVLSFLFSLAYYFSARKNNFQ